MVLVIVGNAPKQALYAQAQTPESIFAAARDAGVAPNVRWLGTLFGPDLADANFGADLHVFPVRDLPGSPLAPAGCRTFAQGFAWDGLGGASLGHCPLILQAMLSFEACRRNHERDSNPRHPKFHDPAQ